MDLSGKRVLVIGGAGLIGSHTIDALLETPVAEIRIYDNFTRGTNENIQRALQDDRVHVFADGGDIRQTDVLAKAMEGIDGVFHFAALWLLHCHEYPRSAFQVNVEGTMNVVEACLAMGVQRLVYSSSASVYGDAVEEPMTEDHPFNNTTFYGATKVAGEQFIRSLYHRYRDEKSFEYVGLRYMNVYGPRQDYRGAYISVIMRILDRIASGEPPIVYGDGSQAYDFINVKDCARANVLAMQASAVDEFYNVGTGVRTSISELAKLLLEETGSDLKVQYEPAGPTFVKNRVGCPKKAARDLGFQSQIDLREGLRQVIQWRRQRSG